MIEANKIEKQKEIQISQHFSKQIIFTYVAYLTKVGKFILFGDNNQLYHTINEFQTINPIVLYDKYCQHLPMFQYSQLLECPSGNYFYLSTGQQCDIFDCNSTRIFSIKISGKLIIIPYESNVILLNIENNFQQISPVIIKNVIKTRNLKIIQNNNQDFIGNPGIDIVKGSLVKFGKHFRFQMSEELPLKHFYISSAQDYYKMKNYLKKLKISDFQFYLFNHPVFHIEEKENLQLYLITRVPIQLCIAENQSLTPMINGFRGNINLSKNIKIEERAKLIQLGSLEELLKTLTNQVYVISIIGRQSSGKSYLLNRLFGTRYSVAACRCTNGIWGSFAKIHDHNFLILDCEGLFSQERSSKEEQLMLAFLTSISDITMLNQDLSSNRNLTELLQNLSQASRQLKGDTLFKGQLNIIVRDVSTEDNRYVDQELLNSLIDRRTGNQKEFLEILFQNPIQIIYLVNNEHLYFDQQVKDLQKNLIKNLKIHWKNGRQLIQTIKITLCQLEMFDKTDASILEQKTEILQIIQNLKIQWYFELAELSGLEQESIYHLRSLQHSQGNQNEILEKINQFTREKVNQKYLQHVRQLEHKSKNQQHNECLKKINFQLISIVEQQKLQFQTRFESIFKKIEIYNDIIPFLEQQKSEFFDFLEGQLLSFTFCLQKCQQCFLSCSYFNAHISDTQKKISEINQEIEKLQNKQLLHNKITSFSKQLIEEFYENNDKIEKLQRMKINREITEKLFQLQSEFLECIQDHRNSQQLIENLKSILGNYQNFYQYHPSKTILEQLNQLKIYLIQQCQIEKYKYEKFQMESKISEEDDSSNDLKADYLQQNSNFQVDSKFQDGSENLSLEIKNLMQKIKIQKLDNEEAIVILEKEFTKITKDLEQIYQDIDYYTKEKEKIKLFLEAENQEVIMNHIKQQISEYQELTQQIEQLESDLQDQQFKNKHKIRKQQDQQAHNQLQNQINEIKQKLIDYAIIKKIEKNKNNMTEDQMIQQFLQNQNVQYQEFDQELTEALNEKEEFELLQTQLQDLINQRKVRENLKEKQIQEMNKIKQKVEQNKQQSENIEILIGIISQKLNFDQNVSNDQQIQLCFEESQNLQDRLNQLLKEQENCCQKIQILEEQIQLDQKLADLYSQREEISKNKTEHSCQKDQHQCEDSCCQCQGVRCKLQAGHEGNHFCEKLQHQCTEKCFIQDCDNACIQYIGHEQFHKCNKIHCCQEICQFCSKMCSKNILVDHLHSCSEKYCSKKCYHCEQQCKEEHTHSKETEVYHFCAKTQHECKNECQEPGYCRIVYEQKIQTYETKQLHEEYVEYVQIGQKQNCIMLIKAGDTMHEGRHVCSITTDKQFHTCDCRCPDCNALCILQYGHRGKHSTQQHRNKDSQIYTQIIGEQITSEKESRFKIGDSSKIENCTQYCERKGRGHFHIVECKGGFECLEKKHIEGTRHSQVKYAGYESLNFDEVLCSSYWNLRNWEHSVLDDEKKNEIDKCNHYCTICKGDKKSFCTDKAWHSKSKQFYNHTFECSGYHFKEKFSSIEICFVIDSTGSMQPYLTNSIDVIKEIVQKAQQYKLKDLKCQIKFSIVAYKDHVYDVWFKKLETTANILKFTADQNTCIQFLSKITTQGNPDIPEAVLDGLNYGINMNWSKNSYKILYLITDAPPHGNKGGRIYHNFEDDYPTGCPCGLKQTPLLQQMIEKDIKFKIIKLNDKIEMMITEFQKDYEHLEVYQVANPEEYISKIVEDVSEVLDNQYIAYDETKFQRSQQ